MFSKKGKRNYKGSITDKLILLYTASTLILFFVFAFFLYWVAQKAIKTGEIQYVVDEIQVIKSLYDQHNGDVNYLTQEVNGVPAALQNASYHYFVELLDANQHTVMITPGMNNVLSGAFFPLVDKLHWDKHIKNWTSPNDKNFILLSAPIAFDKVGHVILSAHIGLDDTYQRTLLKTYVNELLLFLVALIGSVMIISRFIAHKGLRDLYNFTHITENISPTNLAERINLAESPKELVPLGQAYNSMLIRLEDAFTRLSQCASELAHELRIPLHNLRGETEVALTQSCTLSQYRELLESNMEEYQRLSQLVENILFLARTENPHNIIHLAEINAEEEIENIVEFFNILAAEKNISLSCSGDAILKVEPILFQRVLYNLLANALAHTPNGGNVKLEIIPAENFIMIIISDNGCGIPQDALPHILERFYRVKSHEKNNSGSGLGLAIVKSIMELHHGKITIESQYGKGTSVKLYFPKYHP